MKSMLAILAVLALAFLVVHTVQTIPITVATNGFEPSTVHLKAGRLVRLVVTRRVQHTCATEIVVPELGIKVPLPLNTPVVVALTPSHAESIRYACAMDMVTGQMVVR